MNDDETISPQKRGLFGLARPAIDAPVLTDRSYSLLSEMLKRSATERWDFSKFVEGFYVGFTRDGSVTSNDLEIIRVDKRILCWIKLSRIDPLRAVRLSDAAPAPLVPDELLFSAVEIASQLAGRRGRPD